MNQLAQCSSGNSRWLIFCVFTNSQWLLVHILFCLLYVQWYPYQVFSGYNFTLLCMVNTKTGVKSCNFSQLRVVPACIQCIHFDRIHTPNTTNQTEQFESHSYIPIHWSLLSNTETQPYTRARTDALVWCSRCFLNKLTVHNLKTRRL